MAEAAAATRGSRRFERALRVANGLFRCLIPSRRRLAISDRAQREAEGGGPASRAIAAFIHDAATYHFPRGEMVRMHQIEQGRRIEHGGGRMGVLGGLEEQERASRRPRIRQTICVGDVTKVGERCYRVCVPSFERTSGFCLVCREGGTCTCERHDG